MVTHRDGKLQKAAYWKWLEDQIEKVNAELEKTVEARDDALKRLEALMEENEKLRSRLRAYENPNTPPRHSGSRRYLQRIPREREVPLKAIPERPGRRPLLTRI